MKCSYCGYEQTTSFSECKSCGTQQNRSVVPGISAEAEAHNNQFRKRVEQKKNITIDFARLPKMVFKFLNGVHNVFLWIAISVLGFSVFLNIRDLPDGTTGQWFYYLFQDNSGLSAIENMRMAAVYKGITNATNASTQEYLYDLEKDNIMGWVQRSGNQPDSLYTLIFLYVGSDTIKYSQIELNGNHQYLAWSTLSEEQAVLAVREIGTKTPPKQMKVKLSLNLYEESEMVKEQNALLGDSTLFINKGLWEAYRQMVIETGYVRDSIIVHPSDATMCAVLIQKESYGYQFPYVMVINTRGEDYVINEQEYIPLMFAAEWKELEGTKYFSFQYQSAGTGVTSNYFVLMETATTSAYSLEYTRLNSVSEYFTEGEVAEVLNNKPVLLEYLRSRAALEPLVFDEDKIDSPEYFPDKWRLLNEQGFEGLNSFADSLIFPEYRENLFEMVGSSVQVEESNEFYEMKSFFKGPVIGFNKKSKTYFVVWAPMPLYPWWHFMKLEANTVTLSHEQIPKKFIINLKTGALKTENL